MCHKHSPSPNPRPDPQTDPQNGPKWGVSGDPKKGAKLSRLGELLNTQKNVHFLRTREPPRGGGSGHPKMHPILDPFWGASNTNNSCTGDPKDPLFGSDFGPIFGPIFGPFWRPGAGPPRGGIFRIFRISGISGFPARPGPSPGTPLPGGVAGGVTWEVL